MNGYRGHIKLAENLPLSTPLMIMVDVCNICNFRCSFCPTAATELLKSFKRPQGVMELELFYKIIDDISEFDKKIKTLQLHKDGEPFLNKNLGKMISCAKSRDIADSIAVASNGSLIDESRAIEVIKAGLDRIKISVEHVNAQGYKKITATYSDYETIRKNVEFLFRERNRNKSNLQILAKIIDTGLSPDEKGKFLEDFTSISDNVNIDTLMGWSLCEESDFTLGTNVSVGMDSKTPIKRDRKICPLPFYTMAINFNGMVSVCCVDWSWGTIIGDARKEKLIDIWNGKKMKEFRRMHLRNQRSKINTCANCHYLLGLNQRSDIDNYSGELLVKFDNWL